MKKKLYERVTKNMTKVMIGIFIALFAIFVALSSVPSSSKLLYVGKFVHWCVSFLVGSVFAYIVYALLVAFGLSLVFSFKKRIKITLDWTLFGALFILLGSLILIANSVSLDGGSYLTFSNFSAYLQENLVNNFPNVDAIKNGGVIGLFLVALINSGMTYIGSNVIGSILLVFGAIFVLGKPLIKFIKYLKAYYIVHAPKENGFSSAKDIGYDFKEIKEIFSDEKDFKNLEESENVSEQNFEKPAENHAILEKNNENKKTETNYFHPGNERDELILNPTQGLVKAVFDNKEQEQVEEYSNTSLNHVIQNEQSSFVPEPTFKNEVVSYNESVQENENYSNYEDEKVEEEAVSPEISSFNNVENAFEENKIEEINEPNNLYQEEETLKEEQVENKEYDSPYVNKTIIPKKKKVAWKNLKSNFLDLVEAKDTDEINIRESETRTANINIIFNDLGVKARVVSYTIGPSVTRFDVEPDKTTKIAAIQRCMDDVYQRIGGLEGRFSAIVPGKTTAGIELPNVKSKMVSFRECYEELGDSTDKLEVVFGKDINGKIITADLCEMPHLLVAGTTGSGKSIFVHGLIMSLIMKHSCDDLRLVMVDPKCVEFSKYKTLPHLLCPVITEPSKAYAALLKLCEEMDRRYGELDRKRVSNIGQYNKKAQEEGFDRMSYIVVIIDEFADLMDTNRKCSEPVARIGQKARACGIHMIIATQRPSVNVITGVIKANIPSRVALSCGSATDSMTIIGEGGAENLLGKGDMLVQSGALARKNLLRIQGCFVSNDEIYNVATYLSETYETDFDENFLNLEQKTETKMNPSDLQAIKDAANEDMYLEIKSWVMSHDYTSISKIQQNFNLGFPKASKYFVRLAQEGVISDVNEANNAKGRKVLLHDFSQIASEEPRESRGGSLEMSTMDYSKRDNDY